MILSIIALWVIAGTVALLGLCRAASRLENVADVPAQTPELPRSRPFAA